MRTPKLQASRLPLTSGVYFMKDNTGSIIYIGKAKNLRHRVKAYFAHRENRPYIPHLLAKIQNIDFICTDNEHQAILLERDLVAKFKPRYNVQLKDDKFPYQVRVDLREAWPKLELVRRTKTDGAIYLGPFANSFELKKLLEVIRKTIPLRTCSDQTLRNSTRPCLEFQMKRCLAPCYEKIDRSDYIRLVERAISILKGDSKEKFGIKQELLLARQEQRFEDAAILRDRLLALQNISTNTINYGQNLSIDAFAIVRQDDKAEIFLIQIRKGRLIGAKSFGFENVAIEDTEVLESIIEQYYTSISQDIPDELVTSIQLSKLLTSSIFINTSEKNHAKKIKISTPKRGPKFEILLLTLNNAKDNFAARFGHEAIFQK